MELWIRSQDKDDLIKVCSLEVASRSNDKYTILTLINSSTVVDLGTYETKERALEILDKIENKMAYINDEYVTGHNNLMIFEMPEK